MRDGRTAGIWRPSTSSWFDFSARSTICAGGCSGARLPRTSPRRLSSGPFVHFERFDPERPLLPWLFAIARRLCLDLLRREKAMPHAEGIPVIVDPAPGPEREVLLKEELSRLERALADLDEGPREAMFLFHLEEMSYRDIAAALEVPMGTVMTWLHRGRAQLREMLEHAAGSRA